LSHLQVVSAGLVYSYGIILFAPLLCYIPGASAVQVMVILLVCGIGVFYMEAKNFSPFMPYGFGGWSFFGVPVFGSSDESGEPTGVLAGAALVFFAYIGFDCVTCQTEEAIKYVRCCAGCE